jgi:hypothetical protein
VLFRSVEPQPASDLHESAQPVAQADAARTAVDNSAVAGSRSEGVSEMGVAPSAPEAASASRVEPNPKSGEPAAPADVARTEAADNSAIAGAMSEMGVAPSAREADAASRVEPQATEPQSPNPTPAPHDAAGMTPEERAATRASVPDANIAAGGTIAQAVDAPLVPRAEQPGPAPVAPISSRVADEADLPIIMPMDAGSLMQPDSARARKKKRGSRRETSANDAVAEATAPGAAPPMAPKSKATKRKP